MQRTEKSKKPQCESTVTNCQIFKKWNILKTILVKYNLIEVNYWILNISLLLDCTVLKILSNSGGLVDLHSFLETWYVLNVCLVSFWCLKALSRLYFILNIPHIIIILLGDVNVMIALLLKDYIFIWSIYVIFVTNFYSTKIVFLDCQMFNWPLSCVVGLGSILINCNGEKCLRKIKFKLFLVLGN